MLKKVFMGSLLLLLLSSFQPEVVFCAETTDVRQDRVDQLQDRLKKLQTLLEKMQQLEELKKPPSEAPLQAVLDFSEERSAYAQYAYLLAPHMQKERLDAVLQQLHFFAGRDELKERGTLFVVPSLPLTAGETMTVANYSRELAKGFLQKAGLPSANEALLLVSPEPLTKTGSTAGPLLLIDLANTDSILRARMLELLQRVRLFDEPEGMTDYLWQLLRQAAPQVFRVAVEGRRLQLAIDRD